MFLMLAMRFSSLAVPRRLTVIETAAPVFPTAAIPSALAIENAASENQSSFVRAT